MRSIHLEYGVEWRTYDACNTEWGSGIIIMLSFASCLDTMIRTTLCSAINVDDLRRTSRRSRCRSSLDVSNHHIE